MNTAVRTLSQPGDFITHQVPGTRIEITIRWTQPGETFAIEVYQGTLRIDALCKAYGDMATAYKMASHLWNTLQVCSVEQLVGDQRAAQQGVLAATREVVNAEAQRIAQPEFQTGSAVITGRCFTDTVPATGRRNTARVSTEPTSDAMDRILLAAALNDGWVQRSKDANSKQLIALHGRRLVELTRAKQGSTWKITGATLNAAGWRHVEQMKAQVA